MFKDNLKNLRKAKGLSQEELAERLHVVRQTISKWEKGLSVPDADMLIKLSEIFETSVSQLLSSNPVIELKEDLIVEKLEQLNFTLAERNKRSRLVTRLVLGSIIFSFVASIFFVGISIVSNSEYKTDLDVTSHTEQIIE